MHDEFTEVLNYDLIANKYSFTSLRLLVTSANEVGEVVFSILFVCVCLTCLSVCLSVSRITAKAISQFQWNLIWRTNGKNRLIR